MELNAMHLQQVTRCPLCQSPERAIFEHDHRPEDRMCVVRCTACSFIYMNAVVAPEDLAAAYAGYNSQRDTVDAEREAKRQVMYGLDYTFAKTFLPEKADVLDIGCGRAEFLAYFDGCQKSGVEIDAEARAQAAARYPDVTLYAGREEIPAGLQFDALIFRGTIQYMPDLAEAAAFCAGRLRQGGKLILLATPNADSLLAQLQKEYWVMCNRIEHRYWFTIRHLQTMLGADFVLRDYDLPYLKTPYENYPSDLQKVLALCTDGSTRKERFPFFGTMMNVVFERV